MPFKDTRSVIICANLVEGMQRKISVKLFLIWVSGSGEDV